MPPRQYTAENLLIRPRQHAADPGLLLSITPDSAGWDALSFQARRLGSGSRWEFETGENELALVDLTGRYTVRSGKGDWTGFGGRRSVFEGGAHALVLPPRTAFSVEAEVGGEFAAAWAPAREDRPPLFIRPEEVRRHIRGGDNASRQINDLLPPGAPVQRLVLVEVYTPGGNWSSYPPHKHDVHVEDDQGNILEADLEEVYYYKIDQPEGFALQRIYTDERSPLHQAGCPIDALVCATDGCAVLVPEGYHPVVAAPGYTCYYLNALAGSAPSLANRDDPRHGWVKESYQSRDGRLPLY